MDEEMRADLLALHGEQTKALADLGEVHADLDELRRTLAAGFDRLDALVAGQL